MRFPVVLFDLDGTLVDSGPMILASFRHATRAVLGYDIPDERLLAGVGGTTLREQMDALEPTRAEELVDAYRAHNAALHDDLAFFPGMQDVVERLQAEGRRLGIVSAKRRQTIDLAFKRLPGRHLFGAIVGSDELERGKPHPDGILLALEQLGGRPEDAAYVGDSPYDIGAARAAGVHAVAVAWGGIHPPEVLEAAGPDAMVYDAGELLALLA
jgi:pyrophosphatase PpaX